MMRCLLVAAVLGCASPPVAAGEGPCPRQLACWQVRLAVNRYGESAAVDHARACGWTEAKIAEARKCVR